MGVAISGNLENSPVKDGHFGGPLCFTWMTHQFQNFQRKGLGTQDMAHIIRAIYDILAPNQLRNSNKVFEANPTPIAESSYGIPANVLDFIYKAIDKNIETEDLLAMKNLGFAMDHEGLC